MEDGLPWLNVILWPNGDGGFAFDDGPGRRWWVSPPEGPPRTLLPAAPRRSARRAARRHHDGKSWRERLVVGAAEAALFSPVLPRVGPFARSVGATGLDRGVPGALAEVLGLDAPVFAVTLAGPKSNRKPVIQILGEDGTCHGFAKVAADPWTEALLDNEARWLGRPAAPPLGVPDLLFDGRLAGRRVLVQSAVTPPRTPRRRPLDVPPAALFLAVAGLAPRRRAPVTESGWWSGVVSRMEAATAAEAAAIGAAASTVDEPLDLGAWHGDLTPWNTYTRRGRIDCIDWEFAAEDVPVGFDACHFHVQVGMEMLGLAAPDALARAERLAAATLAEVGIARRLHGAVWRCYLIELVRRTLALRLAGLPTDAVHQGAAALEILRMIADDPTGAGAPSTTAAEVLR